MRQALGCSVRLSIRLLVSLIPDIVTAESRGMIFFRTSSRGPGLRANFSFRSSASRARFSLIWASREEPSEAGSAQQHSSSTPSTGSPEAGNSGNTEWRQTPSKRDLFSMWKFMENCTQDKWVSLTYIFCSLISPVMMSFLRFAIQTVVWIRGELFYFPQGGAASATVRFAMCLQQCSAWTSS